MRNVGIAVVVHIVVAEVAVLGGGPPLTAWHRPVDAIGARAGVNGRRKLGIAAIDYKSIELAI